MGMARASSQAVLLILKEAGPAVVHMVAKGSHQRKPLLVSHVLLSVHSLKKVIQPSPNATDRETDSAACWEEGQNHIAKRFVCRETGTNWRLYHNNLFLIMRRTQLKMCLVEVCFFLISKRTGFLLEAQLLPLGAFPLLFALPGMLLPPPCQANYYISFKSLPKVTSLGASFLTL